MMPPVESRKRKERELFHYNKTTADVTPTKPKPSTPLAPAAAAKKGVESAVNNRLLAGYMAYEFLRKGTLVGKLYNPVRAEVSCAGTSTARAVLEPSMPKDHAQYVEVASILKIEGTHLPGIVNPTQLARWIQM